MIYKLRKESAWALSLFKKNMKKRKAFVGQTSIEAASTSAAPTTVGQKKFIYNPNVNSMNRLYNDGQSSAISEDNSYLEKPLFQATLADFEKAIRRVVREELFDAPIRQEKTGKQLYGIKAISEALHVSTATAQRHISKGLYDGAIFRIGKTVVADYDALMAILRCNQQLKYWRSRGNVA